MSCPAVVAGGQHCRTANTHGVELVPSHCSGALQSHLAAVVGQKQHLESSRDASQDFFGTIRHLMCGTFQGYAALQTHRQLRTTLTSTVRRRSRTAAASPVKACHPPVRHGASVLAAAPSAAGMHTKSQHPAWLVISANLEVHGRGLGRNQQLNVAPLQHSHLEPQVQVVPECHLEVANDKHLTLEVSEERFRAAHKHLTGNLLLAAAHTVERPSAGLAGSTQQAPEGMQLPLRQTALHAGMPYKGSSTFARYVSSTACNEQLVTWARWAGH